MNGWSGILRSAACCAGLLACAPALAADWKPESPVEIIVAQGQGGGTDRIARMIQKLLQQSAAVQSSVVNKPGGGGAIGIEYLTKRPADGHAIAVANATLVSTQVMGRSPHGHAEVTPIGLLTREFVAFAVHPESTIRSGRDLIERLKRDPAGPSVAIGAAVGNQNHIAMAMVAKSAGADPRRLRTVIFKSGGETETALLGGHVDIGMTSAAAFTQHLRAGTLRLIAVAAPRRLEGDFAAVPTWRELGADSVGGNWYAAVGPRNMGRAPLQYWEQAIAAVTRHADWRSYAGAAGMAGESLGSEATRAFFESEHANLKRVLTELGLVK